MYIVIIFKLQKKKSIDVPAGTLLCKPTTTKTGWYARVLGN